VERLGAGQTLRDGQDRQRLGEHLVELADLIWLAFRVVTADRTGKLVPRCRQCLAERAGQRRLGVPLMLDIPQDRFEPAWVQAMERTGFDGFAITTNIDLGVAGPQPSCAAIRGRAACCNLPTTHVSSRFVSTALGVGSAHERAPADGAELGMSGLAVPPGRGWGSAAGVEGHEGRSAVGSVGDGVVAAVGGRVDGDDVGVVGEVGAVGDGESPVVLVEDGQPAAFGGDVEPAGGGVVGEDVGVVADASGVEDLLGVQVDGQQGGVGVAGDEREAVGGVEGQAVVVVAAG
jgi:hypothetical protein